MIGLLLVNLGTPEAPTTSAVRAYLREFLSDPRVIDIHPVARALLLHAIILPLRSPRSAAAYRSIWTAEGSPLLVHGRALAAAVASELGADFQVELAMRYGQPSIGDALDRLHRAGVDRIVVFPLYPQYASSSTGSTLEAVYRHAATGWNVPHLDAVPPFYDHPGFLDAVAERGREALAGAPPDHVLFSFHGLPERQIKRSDVSGSHCQLGRDGGACCERIDARNRYCYRAHCVATARGLAQRMHLGDSQWTLSFQSRLGRTPWLEPYTDVVLPELARRGCQTVAVFCPAFVADCLETVEEIGIRGSELFTAAGGKRLILVPAPNGAPGWARTVAELTRASAGVGATPGRDGAGNVPQALGNSRLSK
jgi:ferrochelatase